MPIICDTHALLFWVDAPEKLSSKAKEHMQTALNTNQLACADISLWEIAMLFHKKRITPLNYHSAKDYTDDIITALALTVFPITPAIADLSQSELFQHQDPADRLIAATAMVHNTSLITKDAHLHAVASLPCVW